MAVFTCRPLLPFSYRAGQYFAIEGPHLPRMWRYYSIANAPRTAGTLDLALRSCVAVVSGSCALGLAVYRRPRPALAASGLPPSPDSPARALVAWILGCTSVYAALFGAGSLLYGRSALALTWLAVLAVSASLLWRYLRSAWQGATNR